jgi:hypothetical protein
MKTEVTQTEKDMIRGFAKADGMSISAYLKKKALQRTENSPTALMECVEVLSGIAQSINRIATTTLRNKAIYEAEILELLDRMTELEKALAVALKEVRKDGNTRK